MTVRKPLNILMDVDTGVDDAAALALAVTSPEFNLIGVTTVAGNVAISQATQNTLRVLDYVGGNHVPVFRGMSGPLNRNHFDAAHIHGSDGLGGATISESPRQSEAMTAPEFIVQSARFYRDELTLVFVGPLTNLAVALLLEPELPRLVARTVVMGGAFTVPGNATELAEFNIAVDPEAAKSVAESDLEVTWVGLDVTHSANLYRSDWLAIGDASAAPALLVREVYRQSFAERGYGEVYLHDPLALGVVLDKTLVRCRDAAVLVDTSLSNSAGMTRMAAEAPGHQDQVALEVDAVRFRQLFSDILGVTLDN